MVEIKKKECFILCL